MIKRRRSGVETVPVGRGPEPTLQRQGAVFGADAIGEWLEAGWLLRRGTADSANVREAGYDLRIAVDFCVTPDGERHDYGERLPHDLLNLRPGDMALVSSAESLCLPPNMAAHIGIKFSYATNGVLVLTGSFVDPGYGLSNKEWDSWEQCYRSHPMRFPLPDNTFNGGRLHFYLVNHGERDFTVKMGADKVVTLQFLPILGVAQRPDEIRGQVASIRQEFGFDGPASVTRPLRFGLLQSVERRLSEQETSLIELRNKLSQAETEVENVRTGTLPFIQLGVVLVAATLLGISFNAIGSLDGSATLTHLERVRNSLGGDNLGLITLSCIVALSLLAWGFSKIFLAVVRAYRSRSRRSPSDEA